MIKKATLLAAIKTALEFLAVGDIENAILVLRTALEDTPKA